MLRRRVSILQHSQTLTHVHDPVMIDDRLTCITTTCSIRLCKRMAKSAPESQDGEDAEDGREAGPELAETFVVCCHAPIVFGRDRRRCSSHPLCFLHLW